MTSVYFAASADVPICSVWRRARSRPGSGDMSGWRSDCGVRLISLVCERFGLSFCDLITFPRRSHGVSAGIDAHAGLVDTNRVRLRVIEARGGGACVWSA